MKGIGILLAIVVVSCAGCNQEAAIHESTRRIEESIIVKLDSMQEQIDSQHQQLHALTNFVADLHKAHTNDTALFALTVAGFASDSDKKRMEIKDQIVTEFAQQVAHSTSNSDHKIDDLRSLLLLVNQELLTQSNSIISIANLVSDLGAIAKNETARKEFDIGGGIVSEISLSGGVYLKKMSGESFICRGVSIILFDESVSKVYEEYFRRKIIRYRTSFEFLHQTSGLSISLLKYRADHRESVKYTANSDVDGKFKFENVAPGNYFLHAYSSGDVPAMWMIPVTVEAGKSTKLDLANGNATYLGNAY